MDYSKVTAGISDIRAQVHKLATGVPTMLNGLLRTTLVGFGLSLAKEILPTWKEIYDGMYGVDEETTKRLQQAGDNLRSLRKNLQDAQKDLDKTRKDIAFGNAPDVRKQSMLMTDDATLAKDERNLAESIAAWKNLRKELEEYGATKEDTAYITEKLKIQEANLLGIQKERLIVQDKIGDLHTKMSKDIKREELPLRDAFARAAIKPHEVAAARARGDSDFVMGQVNARSVFNTHAAGEALGGLGGMPFLPGIGEIGKQLMQSQEKYMRDVVQKVKIVDIAD